MFLACLALNDFLLAFSDSVLGDLPAPLTPCCPNLMSFMVLPVYQELLSIIADPDYGDITDPVSGRDVAVEFKTAEETGASFPSTSIRVKPNQTPITEDASLLETLTENQKKITEIYSEMSYEDLTTALNEYLNGGSTEEESKEEKKVATPATSYSSKETSDAFDDLFNN